MASESSQAHMQPGKLQWVSHRSCAVGTSVDAMCRARDDVAQKQSVAKNFPGQKEGSDVSGQRKIDLSRHVLHRLFWGECGGGFEWSESHNFLEIHVSLDTSPALTSRKTRPTMWGYSVLSGHQTIHRLSRADDHWSDEVSSGSM